jgi:hypothetical protein
VAFRCFLINRWACRGALRRRCNSTNKRTTSFARAETRAIPSATAQKQASAPKDRTAWAAAVRAHCTRRRRVGPQPPRHPPLLGACRTRHLLAPHFATVYQSRV